MLLGYRRYTPLLVVICLTGIEASCSRFRTERSIKKAITRAIAEAGLTLADPCPDGFVPCAGQCYARLDTAVAYDQAAADCAERQAHLAVPRTNNENLCAAGLAGHERIWLGITDRQEEGVYRAFDGSVVTASETHWSQGQPDNTAGVENCVEMWYRGVWNHARFAEWNDLKCTDHVFPMCQLDCPGSSTHPRSLKAADNATTVL
ncbi:hepatic lectin-like [Pollicipes pollicipes]|uniref:hepatic lectin-like n=1 Tax=Pollicipes pollicipes TaxID=41117 RepID=UPI0018859AB7|nr:hepatic lectin-like [Pollicipes pollicipes]